MTNARYTGRCACGQVQYEVTGEPIRMVNCHCRDCQRASGSAYAPLLAFEQNSMKLTGQLRYYGVTSERGTRLDRGFCPTCGSPMTVRPEVHDHRLTPALGKTLREQARGHVRRGTRRER